MKRSGIALVGLWLVAQSASAKNYADTTVIIPMDASLQGASGAGLFRAYGLVYQLLRSGIPVDWAIRAGKSYGATDFTANTRPFATNQAPSSRVFAGGPFLIEPANRAAAAPILSAWLASNPQVLVYEAASSFDADLSRALVAAPNLAILQDGYECLLYRYLNAAGIADGRGQAWPNVGGGGGDVCNASPATVSELLSEGAMAGTSGLQRDGALFDRAGSPLYCALFSMHYAQNAGQQPFVVAEVAEHLKSRGALVTTCEATRSFENQGRYLTNGGIDNGELGRSAFVVQESLDHPIAQNTGTFSARDGLLARWDATTGYLGLAGTNYFKILRQQFFDLESDDVIVTGQAFGATTTGRVTYIGGHTYDTNPTSNASRGLRNLFNALLTGPCAGGGSNPAELVPRLETTLTGPASPTGNPVMDFTYTYRNAGTFTALGARVVVTVPANMSISNITGGGVDGGSTITWDLGNPAGALTPPSPASLGFRLTAAAQGDFTITATTTYRRGLTPVSNTNAVTVAYRVTAAPIVTSPILAGATQVSGLCAEVSNTTVRVFVNNTLVGSTSVSNQGWTLTGLPVLSIGAQVSARATASGKVESPLSNIVTVIPAGATPQPTVVGPLVEGGTQVFGTCAFGATVEVFKQGAEGDSSLGFAVVNGSTWSLSSLSPSLVAGWVITAIATLQGFSESPASQGVTVLAKTAPPTVTAPVVVGDPAVVGRCESGATVTLFINNVQVGTAVANGTNYSVAVLGLTAGESVVARALLPGKATSDPSSSVTVLARTAAPVVQGPIATGATSVSGTVTEAGATINVLVDGFARGSVAATGTTFTLSGLSPALAAGQRVSATAQATGKALSVASNVIEVGAITQTPSITLPLTRGEVVVRGTTAEADGTRVELFIAGQLVGAANSSAGRWQVSLTSALVVSAEVRARATATGKATSALSAPVYVRDLTRAPTLASPIVAGALEVRGLLAEADGTQVFVYADGIELAVGALAGGAFSVAVPALSAGQVIEARALAPGKGLSAPSPSVVVASAGANQSAAPVLDAPLAAGATAVSGGTTEADGTLVSVFVDGAPAGNASATAGGRFTANVTALRAGQQVTATATAPGKGTSPPSVPVLVEAATRSPVLATPLLAGATTLSGTVDAPDGTRVQVTLGGISLADVTVTSGAWSVTNVAPLVAGTEVSATATAPGLARSANAPSVVVVGVDYPQSASPSLNAVFAGATLVAGTTTEANGTRIVVLWRAPGASPTQVRILGTTIASMGAFSLTGLEPLQAGSELAATATAPHKGTSAPSTPITVGALTAAPSVLPVADGARAVNGESIEADGTVITVFVDGVAQNDTTRVSGGDWGVSLPSALSAGQLVTAKATAPGKGPSNFGNTVVVGDGLPSLAPSLDEPVYEGATSVTGTSLEAEGALIDLYIDNAPVGRATLAAGRFSIAVPPLSAGRSLTATATAPGETQSAFSRAVLVLGRSASPTLSAPLNVGATQLAGRSTEAAGTVIALYVNGARVATTLVDGSGQFFGAVSALSAGDAVYAIAIATGKAPSLPSPTLLVSTEARRSETPTFAAPLLVGDVVVRGTSREARPTRIDLYVSGAWFAATTVDASGAWVVAGLPPLTLGQGLTATATAPGKGTSAPATTTVLQRSQTPVITALLGVGDTAVAGISTEAAGTRIGIFVNGVEIGSGVVLPNGTFSVTVPALALGAGVTAVASATGKAASLPSSSVVVLARTEPPVLAEPIRITDTVISGTCQAGSAVSVYVNGVLRASGVCVGTGFTFTSVGTLVDGDGITATALAPGFARSRTSASATVYGRTESPTLSAPLVEGATALGGICPVGAVVEVLRNGSVLGTAITTGAAFSLQGLTPALAAGDSLVAVATAAPRIASLPSVAVVVLRRSPSPALTAPLVEGDIQVSGTCNAANGTLILVRVNGVPVASTSVSAGAFTATVSPLAAAASVTATATAVDEAESLQSTVVVVLRRTLTPAVDAPLLAGAASVTGTSTEASGTRIDVQINAANTAMTSVDATGRFAANVAPLVVGQSVTAVATANGAAKSRPSAAVLVTPPIVFDAGVPDAGVVDGGVVDGGVVDAGAVDAGAVDAGVPDAGATDGGAQDAGTQDGGARDAGTIDAGLADGGIDDGGPGDGGLDGGPADGGMSGDGGIAGDAGFAKDGGFGRIAGGAFSCASTDGAGASSAVWLLLAVWLLRRRRRAS